MRVTSSEEWKNDSTWCATSSQVSNEARSVAVMSCARRSRWPRSRSRALPWAQMAATTVSARPATRTTSDATWSRAYHRREGVPPEPVIRGMKVPLIDVARGRRRLGRRRKPSARRIQMTKQPPRLSLAHTPTPLERLARMGDALGVELHVKRDDLTGSAETGNKIRKLEFLLAEAVARGADTVVTCGGEQSNHCRATAVAAARLGMRSRLLLRTADPSRPPPAEGNLLLDELV